MSIDSVRSNLVYAWNQIIPSSSAVRPTEGTHIHYHVHCREMNFLQPYSPDVLGNMTSEAKPTGIGRFKQITCHVLLVLGALMTFLSAAALGTQLLGISFYYLPPSLGNLFIPALSVLLTGLQVPGNEAKSISDFHKFFSLVQRSAADVL